MRLIGATKKAFCFAQKNFLLNGVSAERQYKKAEFHCKADYKEIRRKRNVKIERFSQNTAANGQCNVSAIHIVCPLHHRVVHTHKAFGHTRKTGSKYVLVDAVFTVIFFKRSIRKGHKIRDGRFNLINRRFQKGGDLL